MVTLQRKGYKSYKLFTLLDSTNIAEILNGPYEGCLVQYAGLYEEYHIFVLLGCYDRITVENSRLNDDHPKNYDIRLLDIGDIITIDNTRVE